MSSSDPNKNWASEYLIDPLTEPTPAEETGLGTSFRPNNNKSSPTDKNGTSSRVQEHKSGSSTISTNPFRRQSPGSSPSMSKGKASISAHSRELSTSSAGASGALKSPTSHGGGGAKSASHSRNSSASNNRLPTPDGNTRPRRSSSLRERYPGDKSLHPLDTLTKEQRAANRSSHLKKKHHHGADSIDKLDDVWTTSYHHESPFDAASLARNNSFESGPLAALEESNLEALKATPREKIQDSLQMHRPLDGVAYFPPGQPDPLGRVYNYKEGTDLMIEEGGNYKRWPGVDYHPDDLKGKGEPSYTIEKQLKEHDAKTRAHTRGSSRNGDIELVERPRSTPGQRPEKQGAVTVSGAEVPREDWEGNRSRSGSGSGNRLSGEIRRRLGSLRKKDRVAAME